MKYLKILFPIILFLTATAFDAPAQGKTFTLDDYKENTLYLQGNNAYVKNNVLYSGHRSLVNEFSVSPGGLDLYLRSRRNRNIGMVVSLFGTAGSIYALVNRNRVDWRPFFWASIGTGLIAAPLNMKASKQLNQAVWLRNKDVLSVPQEIRP